jgi:hypothetical protein
MLGQERRKSLFHLALSSPRLPPLSEAGSVVVNGVRVLKFIGMHTPSSIPSQCPGGSLHRSNLVGPCQGYTHLFTMVDKTTCWAKDVPVSGTRVNDYAKAFLKDGSADVVCQTSCHTGGHSFRRGLYIGK